MYRRYRRRGGLHSILWLLIIILFVFSGFHLWWLFLVGTLLSVILSVVIRRFMTGSFGAGLFGSMMNQQQQPPQYQPPYQPYQPPPQQPYQPYGQGYQPPPQAPGAYQEGGEVYYQPSQQQPQYEQPQVQYPQEMPPQQ